MHNSMRWVGYFLILLTAGSVAAATPESEQGDTLAAAASSPGMPTFRSLDPPPELGTGAGPVFYPLDINNVGHIAGWFVTEPPNGQSSGYLTINRLSVRIEPSDPENPDLGSFISTGIGDKGVVVGTAGPNYVQFTYSWIYADGVFKKLPVPQASVLGNWFVKKINTRGEIVGNYQDQLEGHADQLHAVLLKNGTFTNIDYPSNERLNTAANDINDRGDIVGHFALSDVGFGTGFIRSVKGRYTAFKVPNALSTSANGINNQGHVVGNYLDESFNNHGFLMIGGRVTTIDIPGSIYTTVNGINDSDLIVGNYQMPYDANDPNPHAFIGDALSFRH